MSKTHMFQIDAGELETRTLAKLQQDAENMSEGQRFKRASDLDGLDTQKLKQLLDVKVQKNLLDKGCPDLPDIHKTRAAELFDVSEEEVTKAQRDFAKCYYYAENYGNPQKFAEFLAERGLPEPINED